MQNQLGFTSFTALKENIIGLARRFIRNYADRRDRRPHGQRE